MVLVQTGEFSAVINLKVKGNFIIVLQFDFYFCKATANSIRKIIFQIKIYLFSQLGLGQQ